MLLTVFFLLSGIYLKHYIKQIKKKDNVCVRACLLVTFTLASQYSIILSICWFRSDQFCDDNALTWSLITCKSLIFFYINIQLHKRMIDMYDRNFQLTLCCNTLQNVSGKHLIVNCIRICEHSHIMGPFPHSLVFLFCMCL